MLIKMKITIKVPVTVGTGTGVLLLQSISLNGKMKPSRNPLQDAAERFQEEAGISADIDLSLLDNRIKIRDYIQVRYRIPVVI
jgi:hypothetical protein